MHRAYALVLDGPTRDVDSGAARADEVGSFGALLLVAEQVGFHEDGAAFAQSDGGFGGEGFLGEFFFDAHAESFGLFFEEAAGSGGAGVVHFEVHDDASVPALAMAHELPRPEARDTAGVYQLLLSDLAQGLFVVRLGGDASLSEDSVREIVVSAGFTLQSFAESDSLPDE